MLWIIIALVLIGLGIYISIKEEDWEPLVIATGISIVFLLLMVMLTSWAYGHELKSIKYSEKEIPLQETELLALERDLLKNPTTYEEYKQQEKNGDEIYYLRKSIIRSKAEYFGEFNHLRIRNPWTNIFVLFNGKFVEEPIDFSKSRLPSSRIQKRPPPPGNGAKD
ncbi:MAG: hypothetical protein KKF50_05380 [Nanoarchaeota archaeon]|nr:hypothetical protein [Nanoarchaeota archaeon]